ncbi:unnamed protein product [Ostreobium quekettii]|uniref:Uncharacterized protein n=1 Tax=Ostreobium quekettii TaxID=121088 RepID=A0A8S1JA17_9CHLO|nr:unnamed protein product [Ostreobium quekettii]
MRCIALLCPSWQPQCFAAREQDQAMSKQKVRTETRFPQEVTGCVLAPEDLLPHHSGSCVLLWALRLPLDSRTLVAAEAPLMPSFRNCEQIVLMPCGWKRGPA